MPLCLLLIAGCGDDEEAARRAEKERGRSALNKVAGLKMRFQQLDATLSQLEVESDIQKQKVSAAKAELRAIRDTLSSGRMKEFAADLNSSAPVIAAQLDPKNALPKEAEVETARDGVFRMLVILLFLAFAAVYLGKLWRDRNAYPSVTPDYGNAETPSDSSPTPPLS